MSVARVVQSHPVEGLSGINYQVIQRMLATKPFWMLQLWGWLAYAILTELMIKLPGQEPWQIHLPHLVIDTIFGFILTLMLREIFRRASYLPSKLSVLIHVISLILFCLLWTQIKWITLMWLYGHPTELMTWFDFGTWTLASLTMLSTWSGFYYALKAWREGMEQKQRAAEAIHKAQETQLKMLRYQLNPHFMFNSINAICTLILKEENLEAVATLEKLCELLRYSLYTNPLAKVTVAEEIQILNTYFDIEKCRFKEKLEIDIQADAATCRCLLPSLLLQPLVENAIKHGMKAGQENLLVTLNFSQGQDQLNITISDNGRGFELQAPSSDVGIGLQNCQQRLQLTYPDKYQFNSQNNEQGGAMITLSIPKETE